MNNWNDCKNILCIRADNMGDLLMSSPAIRALKETFDCRITILTSKMGALIAPYLSCIDEIIVADLPWIKTTKPADEFEFKALVEIIQKRHFDAAVIFTVYSQNPLPAALLAFMAGIPKRLAYCRENPYHLLTDWCIEKEPYTFIQHQVKRDLALVDFIGAKTSDENLHIDIDKSSTSAAMEKLDALGLDRSKDWLILHPGVSEQKREYPGEEWIKTGRLLKEKLSVQLLITGASSEKHLCDEICSAIGDGCFSGAAVFSVQEFIAVINEAPLVISVNTGTVHIAAAMQTPVLVLYALTNPQHTPWNVPSSVLYFSVKETLQSNNQVVNFVNKKYNNEKISLPTPEMILEEAGKLLTHAHAC
jgi:ADP-heptose:LPS heptosyltransferase